MDNVHSIDKSKVLQGLRPYSPGDIEALADLLGAAYAWPPPLPPTPQDLLGRWRNWSVDPEHSISVLPAPDGSLLAYSQVAISTRGQGRVGMDMAVHPDYRGRGIGSALYNLAEARAYELGADYLTASIYMQDGIDKAGSISFLEGRGFRRNSSYWRLRIDNIGSIEPPSWPHGITCRVFRATEEDAERWAHLIRAAFEEAATAEMVLAQVAEPESSPDGYFFAIDAQTGREVGTSRSRRDTIAGEPVGYLGTVGVLPEYRGMGIAEALIRQSLRYMASRGLSSATLFVEDANAPARTLYDKMGWYVLYRTDHYWKTLAPPSRWEQPR